MIIYMVDKGAYITPEESFKKVPTGKRGVYVNLTNKCPCACTFCLRSLKKMPKKHSLWLEKEPTVQEVLNEFQTLPKKYISEVVFCGFGEPTMRLKEVCDILYYLRVNYPKLKTRLNTNGLSDLIWERETAKDFKGLLDIISISLNASNKERYLELTRSKYGVKSFEAMLNFAIKAKKYIPEVVLTVVEKVEDDEEIEKSKALSKNLDLKLRIRKYEDS